MTAIQEIIARIHHLPPFPVVVVRVTEILRKDDYDVKDVVAVVKHDPAMVANILKISNAAYFGSRQRITSLQDAVVFWGRSSSCEYYKRRAH